jgi:hypothetical protein
MMKMTDVVVNEAGVKAMKEKKSEETMKLT